MKHIKIYEHFLNEAREKDEGLFPKQGKNSNKFLFGGNSDTIAASMKRVKIPPTTITSNISIEPVGNNYDFQALANQLREWEFDYERGRIRYDIYPMIYFTIPRVAKVVCKNYIDVEPIANLKTSAFSGGDGTDFNGHWYTGNSSGRGPAWLTGKGGSVKVDTVGIKTKLSSVVGNCIRAAAVDQINWKKINAVVQYKGEEPRLFDPSSNQKDLQQWVGDYAGIDSIWNNPGGFSGMNYLENLGEFWMGIEPAVRQLERMLPSEIVVKIKTIDIRDLYD